MTPVDKKLIDRRYCTNRSNTGKKIWQNSQFWLNSNVVTQLGHWGLLRTQTHKPETTLSRTNSQWMFQQCSWKFSGFENMLDIVVLGALFSMHLTQCSNTILGLLVFQYKWCKMPKPFPLEAAFQKNQLNPGSSASYQYSCTSSQWPSRVLIRSYEIYIPSHPSID